MKAWLHHAGEHPAGMAVACIGATSYKACKGAGLPEELLFYPDSPGLESWADTVELAMEARAGIA